MNVLSIVVTSAVSSLISGGLAFLLARMRGGIKRERALQEGVKNLLRGKLIDYYEKYSEKGVCPIYAKESVRRSYEAYHELGGNGVITKLYEELMALPAAGREPENEGD